MYLQERPRANDEPDVDLVAKDWLFSELLLRGHRASRVYAKTHHGDIKLLVRREGAVQIEARADYGGCGALSGTSSGKR